MQRQDYQRYNKYKWILWLVIISFVIWGAGSLRQKDIRLMAARVGSHEVSHDEFVRAYRRQHEFYQQFAKDNPELLKNLPKQVLDGLVNQKLLLLLAEEQGFSVSDDEVVDKIRSFPVFQDEGGKFVGPERYRAILENQLHETASAFEASVKEDLTAQKLQDLIQDAVVISEQDLKDEYEQGLTVRFDYVKSDAGKYVPQVTVSDPEIQAYYEKNKESYRAPERRSVSFVYARPADFMDKVQVTDEEVAAQYERNKETYKKEEERRASHILFKTEPKGSEKPEAADAAAKDKAEKALARAKAGEDFEAIAKDLSEDSTASQGGDLDFFPRGRMTKPFEEKVFAMQIGEVSDLVKSESGYHIIKLTDVRPGGYTPLDDVKPQIQTSLRRPRAEELAKRKALEMRSKAAATGDLKKAAAELGMEIKSSGFFGHDDNVPGLGRSDDFAAAVFAAPKGKVSDVIEIVPTFARMMKDIPVQGYAVFVMTDDPRPPAVPPLAEARPQVEKDLRTEKARALAKQEAAELEKGAAAAKTADEWKAVFEAKGYKAQDSGTIGPRTIIPGIPDSGPIVRKAWGGKVGEAGSGVTKDGDTVFFLPSERKAFDAADFAQKRKEIRDRIQSERRSQLQQSILKSARERFKVEYNNDVLQEFKSERT